MKNILLIFVISLLISSCGDDETTYRNSLWEGANGIIKPDTLSNVININPNDFDFIFRSSTNNPSFPENDETQLRYVFASHFKKGNEFGEVNSFKLNNQELTFYISSFYPSYLFIDPNPFSFNNNQMSIEFADNNQIYNYDFEVEDVFESLTISNSTLSDDIELSFDKKWEFYSVHAFLYFTEEFDEKKVLSLNKTYEIITSEQNKLIISKSEIENVIFNKLGTSLGSVNKISFTIVATDTTHLQLNDKKGLLYKNSEKVLNFDYNSTN